MSAVSAAARFSSLLLAALISFAADPVSFESRKAAIRALLAKQDFAAALDQAKSINREWPDDIAAYQLIVEAELGLGHYTEAESALQWMLDLRIGKADAQGWLMVARFREVIGDIDGAMDAVNSGYTKVNPATEPVLGPALLAYSGHLQWMAGKVKNAETVLRQCLQAAPDHEAALEALAEVRIVQGRHAEAREILAKVARGGNPRFLFRLAELQREPAAYAEFERAARARMTQTDNANRELVLYYAGRGHRPEEALEIARREAARRHDVFTLDALAVALKASGKEAEARNTMKQVLAVGVRHPEILRHANELGLKGN